VAVSDACSDPLVGMAAVWTTAAGPVARASAYPVPVTSKITERLPRTSAIWAAVRTEAGGAGDPHNLVAPDGEQGVAAIQLPSGEIPAYRVGVTGSS
jgi:hypothetical protein